jgi:hypothetical protein
LACYKVVFGLDGNSRKLEVAFVFRDCIVGRRGWLMQHAAGLLPVEANDEIQQGDLFKSLNSLDDLSGEQAEAQWFLVLTADCDIAQRKLGSCFSVLPIITAASWLEEFWADEKCDHALDKGLLELSSRILAHDKQRDPAVSRLGKEDALKLIRGASRASLTRAFGDEFAVTIEKLVGALKDLDARSGSDANLKAWMGWRKFIGASNKAIAADLRDAFASMRGGYFLLPELPGQSSLGHVVMLRDMRAAPIDNVFCRSIDIRGTKSSAPYFLRMGRLSDTVRFAIAQQVATLFSRVGLPQNFETECDLARESAAEAALERLALNAV